MNTELLKELGIKLSDELREFLNSGHDTYDYAHEKATNDQQDLIYCGKVKELYASAREQFLEVEEGLRESSPDVKTMEKRFAVLAFWIIRYQIESQLREELAELEDELNDKIRKLEEIRDAIDY